MKRLERILLASVLLTCCAAASSCDSRTVNTNKTQGVGHASAVRETSGSQTPEPGNTSGSHNTFPASTPYPTSPAPTTKNPVTTEKPIASVVPKDAEKWIASKHNADNILMTYEQIQKMNTKIRTKCAALIDITSFRSSMPKSELKSLIESSSGPGLPKYDKTGKKISEAAMSEIKANRNLEELKDTNYFKKGVTVQRSDIRALPTDTEFYSKASVQDHDMMQESELPAGSAVWIMHTSKDGKYYYVQAYHYVGWINSEYIADAENSSDWNTYAKLLNMTENSLKGIKFAVVTEPMLTVNGVKLDMGTALLLDDEQNSVKTYSIILPGKDDSGELIRVKAEIPAESANLGYLDYTYRNFYIQAFKYAGTRYGWGGMKDGVDCSSYVLNVYKTFGLIFPRNTSQQNSSVGNITNVEKKSVAEKLSILSKANVPSLLYIQGHVMIYLGSENDVHYIIHAPGSGKVREEAYKGFSSVIRICNIGGEY